MRTLEVFLYLVAMVTMMRIGRAAVNVSKLCVLLTERLTPKKEQGNDEAEIANRFRRAEGSEGTK